MLEVDFFEIRKYCASGLRRVGLYYMLQNHFQLFSGMLSFDFINLKSMNSWYAIVSRSKRNFVLPHHYICKVSR